jgi:hypothetical protein
MLHFILYQHEVFLLRAEMSNQEAALEVLKVIHIQDLVKLSSHNEMDRDELTILAETNRQVHSYTCI